MSRERLARIGRLADGGLDNTRPKWEGRPVSAIAQAGSAPSRTLTRGGTIVLALGALDFGLEQSIIVPALPSLAQHYATSIIGVTWLATGFLLSAAVAVPVFGRLGDLVGKKRMILVSLAAFSIGSLVCALTSSIGLAIAGRTFQGLGAAVAPLTLGLARDLETPEHLPRTIGAVIGSANVGGGIGFLASGLLVDSFSPAAIFWFLFGAGAVLAVGVALLVRETPVRAPHATLDPVGALLLGPGLVLLVLAISKGASWGWSSAEIVGLFAATGVLLTLFVLAERHARDPLVDLTHVAKRPFASTNVCMFGFGFAFFIAVFVIPQIAATPEASGYGLGFTVTQIGWLLVPTSVAGLAGGWLGGRAGDRIGARALVGAGAFVGTTGYLVLAAAHTTAAALGAGSAVIGFGWGLILTGVYPVVLRNAGVDRIGIAAAVTLLFRNVALSVGVTVAAVVITNAGLSGPFPAESGYTRAFLIGAAGAAATFLTAMLLPKRTTAPA